MSSTKLQSETMVLEKGTQGISFKIFQGTPRHDSQSLCASCLHSQIIKHEDSALGTVVLCCRNFSVPPIRILGKVTECNRYSDEGGVSLSDMANIALKLNVDKRVTGFAQATTSTEGKNDETRS